MGKQEEKQEEKQESSSELTFWPNDFNEDSQVFLYETAQGRVADLADWGDRQDSKAVTLFTVSTALLAASGIFGSLELSISLRGALTILTLATSSAAFIVAVVIYWPAGWESGVNVAWMKSWRGAHVQPLRNAGLEVLIEGFEANLANVQRKGVFLRYLIALVAVQAILVAAVQLVPGSDEKNASTSPENSASPTALVPD